MSSHLSLLRNRPSTGGTSFSRPGFKVYMRVANGVGGDPSGYPGYAYYENLGIGYAYDVGLHSITVQATVEADFNARNTNARMFFLDWESGGDTATNWQNVLTWCHGISTAKPVGIYGFSAPLGYPVFQYPNQWGEPNRITTQATNDSNIGIVTGVAPANCEMVGPELYCNGNVDRTAVNLMWYCKEYTRLGLSMPMIPLINPRYPPGRISGTVSAAYFRAMLEIAIRQPNVAGVFIWHADRGTAWDVAEGWLVQTLDFITTYGLTIGTPF